MPTKSYSIIHRVCFEWAGVNRQSRCQVRSSVCVWLHWLFHVGKQESWTQSDASKTKTFSVYVRTNVIN